ncbi:hypothetical protein [Spirosoma areae]
MHNPNFFTPTREAQQRHTSDLPDLPDRGVCPVASEPEMATQKPACRHVQVVAGTLPHTLY